jgi:starch synthase
LRVLFAACEIAGCAKTGGLADVAAALPRALAEHSVHIAVIMPLYHSARRSGSIHDTGLRLQVPVGERTFEGAIWRGMLPGCGVPAFFIEQKAFFDRNDAGGRYLYQHVADGVMRDYADNSARFIFFSRAILEAIRLLDFWPDVLHLNDWQTALAAVYLREVYDRQGPYELRPRYQELRTALTIHNVAYQGIFWKHDMPLTGLPWRLFNHDQLEFYDHLNFLKGGIVYANVMNTVSPTYAQEIQTPYYGCGLQGVLRARQTRLFGIVNGVDYSVWNPATDPHLAARYDVASFDSGKAQCKAALQRDFGLAEESHTPLFSLISRLVDQKGIDLLIAIIPQLLASGAQLVVLGHGDPYYHHALANLQRRHPGRLAVAFEVDEPLAHQVEAGADIFLMPSRYEPCGLNQLYSLKYGTVPIVRATGGLADTVTDATPATLTAGTATGFTFLAQTPAAFFETCQRAMQMLRDQPLLWQQVQRTGMAQDWSWNRSAEEYIRMYRSA